MKLYVLIYFITLIFLDTVCQISLKELSNNFLGLNIFEFYNFIFIIFHSVWTLVILVCYFFIISLYLYLLKKIQLGSLYASVHLNIVTVLIFSIIFLGDKLSYFQTIGAFFITVGVMVFLYTEIC